MTLTAHAIVGAAVVAAVPAHPVLGVCAAFASHFLVDAIPPLDYQVRSASIHPLKGGPLRFDRTLFLDFLFIGGDALLGLVLALLLFATPATFILVALGACAGELPDALQFLYLRYPHEPLTSHQRFHHWIHTTYRFADAPLIGIASQVSFLTGFVILAKLFIF